MEVKISRTIYLLKLLTDISSFDQRKLRSYAERILAKLMYVRSCPRKLNKKNKKTLDNPTKATAQQINQTERYQNLSGSIELAYIHG